MEKSKQTSNISNEKNASLKIYSMKASYTNYLTKDILGSIRDLIGKTINNIPFVNAYINAGPCRLEDVELGEDYISYILDFQKERIIYEVNIPMRVIEHQRVEIIHYYTLNMGCIYENKAIDSVKVLSISMLLAYWALIRNYTTRDIPYGKPFIDTLKIDLNERIQFFEDYLLKYIKSETNDFGDILVPMKNWWEGEVKVKDYEVKIFRKNSIKYMVNLPSGKKHNVNFTDNGQINSTITLDRSLIKKYIILINFIIRNPSALESDFNILNVLEEWITYISKDMYEEYKIRKKISVLEEMNNIIGDLIESEEDTSRMSNDIFMMSIYAQKLFSLCMQDREVTKVKEKLNIDIIEYDSLCTFLKWYGKNKVSTYLEDKDLENILQSYYLYIRNIVN